MDLSATPSEQAFQADFSAWLDREFRPEYRGSHVAALADHEASAVRQRWARALAAGGWLTVSWPREYGGRNATIMELVLYGQEMRRRDAAQPHLVGVSLLGPTLIEFGTEEQKARHLGPIARAEVTWAQGFSEPNAGSDLAGLQTHAELDGDEWVLNGQKIWSSGANEADWLCVLARTDKDAPKHRGISFLLVDRYSPGVTIQPIKQMSGKTDFNAMFFDNVRVPRDDIIGEPGQGWKVVNRLLAYERGGLTMNFVDEWEADWYELRDYARTTVRNGRPLAEDPRVRERLAKVYTDIRLMRLANLRYITAWQRGRPSGEETSFMKLYWVTTNQGLYDLATELAGPDALRAGPGSGPDSHAWMQKYCYSRASSIMGGTQDIQRNIIAERLFGLPR